MSDIGKIFTAEPRSLAEFLSTNDQGCFIPPYQRAYSWDEKDVARLFEDVVDGVRKVVLQESSLRFLGTVIAVDDKDVVPVDPPMDRDLPNLVMTIIDGQQRLSTLMVVNVLLHNALRTRLNTLGTNAETADFTQIVEDNLDDLAKTFRFLGRGQETVYRYYPRLIRAYRDQWSRSRSNARYESPVTRLIWSYVEHLEEGTDGGFTPSFPQGEDADSPALTTVSDYATAALEDVAAAEFEDIAFPPVGQLLSADLQSSGFWPYAFPDDVVSFINSASDEVHQIVRLMAFGRYLNTRMAITLVTTSAEDYAFDMFEALNTTGQPLTAFETFRPKVVEAEGQSDYYSSPSNQHMREIERYLERFKKAEDRQRATSSLLIPFALLDTGTRLPGGLSEQRKYLRLVYDRLPDMQAKREFTGKLGMMGAFLREGWDVPRGRDPLPRPGPAALSDPAAGFCFEALRSLNHDIVIAPLVRFYAEAAETKTDQAYSDYEDAIKAIAAFSMLWRAARGGTTNVDAQYRAIMSGQRRVEAAFRMRDPDSGAALEMPGLSALKRSLWHLLGQTRVGLDEKEAWVNAASQQPIYSDNAKVARFILMTALHNSAPDPDAPGLVNGDGRGNLSLLNPTLWHDESIATIEHVAPESNTSGRWAEAIYDDDSRMVHQLGNLTLLPAFENDVIADRDWTHKRALFAIFAAQSGREAENRLEEARRLGLTESAAISRIVRNGGQELRLCQPIADYDGDWDGDFIRRRSRRLAELAWERCVEWLGPHPSDDS